MPENPRTLDTPAPRDRPSFTILVEEQEIPRAFQVLAVRVQKEANRIPSAYLTLRDGDPAAGNFPLSNLDTFIPGKKITIRAGYQGQEQVIFKGLLVKQGIEARPTGATRLNLQAKDAFVKTTLVPRRRYFTDKKDSEVAEEIVLGYRGLEIAAETTEVKHEELIQYDATDWDFVVMRAEANGQLCFADDGKLTVAKPKFAQDPVVDLQFGATILDLDAEMDARDQAVSLRTSTWNYPEQELARAEAAEPEGEEQGNLPAPDLAEPFGAEPELQHGGRLEQGELQAWADAALLKRRLAKIRGRVRFYGNADVKPGTLITLGGLGDRYNGKALVTGVSHRLEEGSWLTDVQFGLGPRWFGEEFKVAQAPAAALLPPLSGLRIGVVTGLEGDASGEERILVRLPVVDAAAEGTRARVMTLDAGQDRGFFFRPEIGDEVVVGFLHNDPREAVVLGGLHGSQKNLPEPFVTKDDNHLKGYVSRSQMKLLFDDEKKVLTLETPAGNLLRLDEEEKSVTLQDQNGSKIILNDQGIQLESSKDIILKATGDVKLDGINVEQSASAQFKASGSAGAEVSSSATAVLKGAMVQIN